MRDSNKFRYVTVGIPRGELLHLFERDLEQRGMQNHPGLLLVNILAEYYSGSRSQSSPSPQLEEREREEIDVVECRPHVNPDSFDCWE